MTDVTIEVPSNEQILTSAYARIKETLVDAVQTYIDAVASSRGYDGILSACSYATSKHLPFSTEGQACVEYRDEVWIYCYGVLAAVETGTRSVPTPDQLVAELPVMTWGVV
jgi:hypothetical protein